MGSITEALSDKLRQFMDLHGLNQAELGSRIGLKQSMISLVLGGKANLSTKNIEALCRSLGIRWQDLDVEIEVPAKDPRKEKVKAKIDQLNGSDETALEHIGILVDNWIDFQRKNEIYIMQTGAYLLQPHQTATPANAREIIQERLKPTGTAFPAAPVAPAEIVHVVELRKDPEPEQEPEPEPEPIPEPAPTIKDNVVPFDPTFDFNIDEPQPPMWVTVPFFRTIAASDSPEWTEAHTGLWCEIMHSYKKDSWYVLEVSGDSMEPEYQEGDLILMDKAKTPKNGDVVAAWIHGVGGTLKEFRRSKDKIKLIPRNQPKHKIKEYPGELVEIQGVLVELSRRRPK